MLIKLGENKFDQISQSKNILPKKLFIMINLDNQVGQTLNVLGLLILLDFNFILEQFLIEVHALMQYGQYQLANGPLIEEEVMILYNGGLIIVHEILIIVSNVRIILSVPLFQLLNF